MASPRHWRELRALVTGATGFIGAHLTSRLINLGADVHAVSRRPDNRAGPTWHVADLAEAAATAELIRSTAPDVVFHLASAVTGARDPKLVRPVLDANLTAAVNLLTAAVDSPGIRLVLAGSVEETRGAEATPPSPYAAAKSAATGYARMYHRLWDVAVTVLRVAMVYGPAQPDTAKLIPYATLSLLRGQDPELSSGTRLVDWVYVDDVVDAFLAAADTDKAAGQVLDIGSGAQVSIRDTVELLARIVGGGGQPRFGAISDRPLDHAQVADPRPAAAVLGWRPTTSLEEGLRRTVAWYAGTMSP
ncbi:MAG TPA: NAD-dependent epimerase/dehydratase family protein [Actinophytocola sp.]|uniref:NAD-dependent epimerase/dehydratase family protein n=1 Tax=Actinophytocola sp. TaxID=1872138 RepID=UPI002DDD7E9B|nr:NAD-dependent epimerase/dehydratase family protein [Actinophytocola sp.]HEV2779859.1 NAD-dependent epimerase/dehydratase family protein [Actinophytocola sp.]